MYSGRGGYYGLVVVTQPYDQRIASIFYMYIDIGEWIVGKQVVPILLIEGVPSPPPLPRIAKNAKQNYIGDLT